MLVSFVIAVYGVGVLGYYTYLVLVCVREALFGNFSFKVLNDENLVLMRFVTAILIYVLSYFGLSDVVASLSLEVKCMENKGGESQSMFGGLTGNEGTNRGARGCWGRRCWGRRCCGDKGAYDLRGG